MENLVSNSSTGSIEMLRDSKRRMVEQQLHTAIKTTKSHGITRDERMNMLNILLWGGIMNLRLFSIVCICER